MSQLSPAAAALSTADLKSFLSAAEHVGFNAALRLRGPNPKQAVEFSNSGEQFLRSLLPDYAEFFLPVSWSQSDWIGSIVPADGGVGKKSGKEKSANLELIRLGCAQIEIAARREAQGLPTYTKSNGLNRGLTGIWNIDGTPLGFHINGWTYPWEDGYEGYAYLNGTLRGTAVQAPGLFRTGILAVCRKGVAVIGLATPTDPGAWFAARWDELDRKSKGMSGMSPQELNEWFYLKHGDRLDFHRRVQMSIPPFPYEPVLQFYIPFTDFEQLQSFELVRFDGLAALLYAAALVQADWLIEESRGNEFLTFPALVENMKGTKRTHLMSKALGLTFPILEYGPYIITGTGTDSDGKSAKSLLNSGLGISIETATQGRKIFIESIFSELDAALSLMMHGIDSAPKSTIESASKQPATSSIAAELERLLALHQSGALTADEFAAAKAALLARG